MLLILPFFSQKLKYCSNLVAYACYSEANPGLDGYLIPLHKALVMGYPWQRTAEC